METAFLGLAVVLALVGSCGIVRMRGVYDKLHYLAPPTILGTALLAVAVLLREGWSAQGTKALLTLAILAVSNPVLTQALARAEFNRAARGDAPARREKRTREDLPPGSPS